MWKLIFVLALPLAPLAAAHGIAPEEASVQTAAADVQCEIRSKPMAGGIQLEGVVASRVPLSGTYEFDVRKAGRAGTSNSAQSGEFEADTGEDVVGNVGLGLEHGATYEARLVVRWHDGQSECTASGPRA